MYVRPGNGREAEAALIVEDAWQSKGIGGLLLGDLGEEASTGVPYEVKNSLYLLRTPLGKPVRQPVEGVSQRRW